MRFQFMQKKKKNRKHDNIETHYFGFVQNYSKIVLYHQWNKERKSNFFFSRFKNNEKNRSFHT